MTLFLIGLLIGVLLGMFGIIVHTAAGRSKERMDTIFSEHIQEKNIPARLRTLRSELMN
jgi:hypothetical protein